MTAQQYLDLLVATSLAGKFPSIYVDEYGTIRCLYRSPTGCKCAIGVIIPDAKYEKRFDVYRASKVVSVALRDVIDITGISVEGLGYIDFANVQDAHDGIAKTTDPWDHSLFVSQLRELTCFSGLTPGPTTHVNA